MSEQSERDLAQAISELRAAVRENTAAISTLTDRVDHLGDRVDHLGERVDHLGERVGSLEGTMECVRVSLASKLDAGEMTQFVQTTNQRLARLEASAAD